MLYEVITKRSNGHFGHAFPIQGGLGVKNLSYAGIDITCDEQIEVSMLKEALQRSRYNQRRAAEMLGLSYDQLRGSYNFV